MSRKTRRVLFAAVIIPPLLLLTYSFTQNLPFYDQFYTQQERNERDLQRIKRSLPERVGQYVLTPAQKYPFGIEAYDGCFDANAQGTEDVEKAAQCERQIIANYRDPANGEAMVVSFLSVTKDTEGRYATVGDSFIETDFQGHSVFRFKREKVGVVLWYPEDMRNPLLKGIGWYPEKIFLSIRVGQERIARLPSGAETHVVAETMDPSSPVVSYFLKKYPPAEQN